ncbi:hypothetical protein LCGC14_3014480 [marine sediment metagenome]|uniref:Uncharacterized protein n=1 Tax=marine sediment metagenome TaxID=412755 RepID=A0A0F8Z4X4_9ZZZZ
MNNSDRIRSITFDLKELASKARKALDCEMRLEKANQDTVKYNQGWNDACTAMVQGLMGCIKTKGTSQWVTGLDISQIDQAIRKE